MPEQIESIKKKINSRHQENNSSKRYVYVINYILNVVINCYTLIGEKKLCFSFMQSMHHFRMYYQMLVVRWIDFF